jgi:hypothetical protein
VQSSDIVHYYVDSAEVGKYTTDRTPYIKEVHEVLDSNNGYYQIVLDKTTSNIYGEANGTKTYNDPVLINCLISLFIFFSLLFIKAHFVK